MVHDLRKGQLKAVMLDDTILVPIANQAKACDLHILDDKLSQYDLALAFRRTFNDTRLMDAVNTEIQYLLQDGTLQVLHCASIYIYICVCVCV
jgi:ABC-type amino acid transport substrate-binding protein